MGETVSPLTILIMIECATCSDPGANIPSMWKSEAAYSVRDMLVRNEMICGETHKATDRGRAWLDFICKVPFPVQKWIMPS